jgi:NAD(P)-dependent dehydrogenase (short-subunit alcohol dehydrogenase family)
MDDMIGLNIVALLRLTHAAAPGFVERGRGAIINISSIAALAPELLNGVYGGSKAFVLAFSQSLLHELSDKGVRVQVVLPGATATEFWGVAGVPVEHLPAQIVMSAEDVVDAALAGFDQGRGGDDSLPAECHRLGGLRGRAAGARTQPLPRRARRALWRRRTGGGLSGRHQPSVWPDSSTTPSSGRKRSAPRTASPVLSQ